MQTGVSIREFLLELEPVGGGCPYDFFEVYRAIRKITYGSVRRYFWILKLLGLIEPTVRGPSERGGWPKQLYRIVPGREEDHRWYNAPVYVYPATKWGKAGYYEAKAKGLVQLGRAIS